ncbi:MAG TPA: DMT family transporter [Pyrinomonadaceae bacterium]|nr:DMT family transporter [Chloracidobacterium sp.]HRA41901.1 DMT family transporter [Pyrinomonadaceae bacterium]
MSSNKRLSAIILLIVAMIIWGSAFAVTKAALEEVPPVLFALLRYVTASILLIVFVILSGKLAKIPRPVPWVAIVLMGSSGVFLYTIAYNVSLVYTSASQGAMVQSFIPAVTTLFAAAFLRESLSRIRLIGIGISILGIFLIMFFAEADVDAPNSFLGNVMMLLSVILWAGYTLFAKRLAKFDPLVITAGATIVGTALLIPAALFELGNKGFPTISATGWTGVIYLGLFSSAVAMLLYNRSLQYLSAGETANFLNLMPVVAVLVAVVFLGESPTFKQITGGVLVLFGVWVSLQNRSGTPIEEITETPPVS